MNSNRSYKIGERNPSTLPGPAGNEDQWENSTKTRRWTGLLKWAQSSNAVGAKY